MVSRAGRPLSPLTSPPSFQLDLRLSIVVENRERERKQGETMEAKDISIVFCVRWLLSVFGVLWLLSHTKHKLNEKETCNSISLLHQRKVYLLGLFLRLPKMVHNQQKKNASVRGHEGGREGRKDSDEVRMRAKIRKNAAAWLSMLLCFVLFLF